MLSAYFLNTQIHKANKDFIKKKNIYSFDDKDRTVCQMLRNFNYLTKKKHEDMVAKLIYYIHNSVLKLRKYKQTFDEDWWHDSKKEYIRSEYTDFNKNIVKNKSLLTINHDVFKNLKYLYDLESKYHELLFEIIFYTYKINIKLLEYETIFNINEKVFISYTNTWNNICINYDKFIKNNTFSSIKFSYPELSSKCCYYLGKKYNKVNIDNFFYKSRSYAMDIINKGNYDCIIEFGSGWGRNIFFFLDNNIKEIPIIAGEYTSGGLKLCNKIKNDNYSSKNIKIIHFDYNNYELFFENISLIKQFKNILCLSFWSIEQVPHIKKDFFYNLINLFENIRFIHHEPIGWQIDPKKALMKSTDRPNYNKNLWKVLQNLQDESKIKITNTIINYFNFKTTGSMGSLIDWQSITT
tara:strand:+ start:14 stop:1240 length:1227 start_codon:yes stop_codon:yes gene_type:complete